MSETKSPHLSKRNWIGAMAAPALAASLTPGLFGAGAAVAEAPPASPGEEKVLGARTYNIREFGAKGDGETRDTAAVQAAIDACNKDRGGVVLVPAGDFVVGTLELKS